MMGLQGFLKAVILAILTWCARRRPGTDAGGWHAGDWGDGGRLERRRVRRRSHVCWGVGSARLKMRRCTAS